MKEIVFHPWQTSPTFVAAGLGLASERTERRCGSALGHHFNASLRCAPFQTALCCNVASKCAGNGEPPAKGMCVCVFLLKENVSSHSYPIQTVIGLMVDISLHGLAGLVGARSVSVA